MKRKSLTIAALLLMSLIAASCTHHTCPAYRGSVVLDGQNTVELALAE